MTFFQDLKAANDGVISTPFLATTKKQSYYSPIQSQPTPFCSSINSLQYTLIGDIHRNISIVAGISLQRPPLPFVVNSEYRPSVPTYATIHHSRFFFSSFPKITYKLLHTRLYPSQIIIWRGVVNTGINLNLNWYDIVIIQILAMLAK